LLHSTHRPLFRSSTHSRRITCNHHRASSSERMAPFPSRYRVKKPPISSLTPPADELVDSTRPFLIQALCCEALNPVLLESDMHPRPEFATRKPRLLTDPDTRFLPHVRCQSASRLPPTKVYIPTISRYLDSLLAQIQWLEDNGCSSLGVYGPSADVGFLVRYLFLEMPSQRKKLLPLLMSESKIKLEEILDRYNRTGRTNSDSSDMKSLRLSRGKTAVRKM